MVFTCRERCLTLFEVEDVKSKNNKPKCRNCEVTFLNWEGVWCPCCNCRLSNRSKHSINNNRNRHRY